MEINDNNKEKANKRMVLLDGNPSSSERVSSFVREQLSRNPLYAMRMRESEEKIALSEQKKFRCPYCEKTYAKDDSVIVQERPDSLKNVIKGMLTTQRLALPHHVKFTVYQKVFYVRKCKECDDFKFKVSLLSYMIWALFNIISIVVVLYLLHLKPVLFLIPFILSFSVFPIIYFIAGKRVRFDESSAYRYNALTTEGKYKRQ